jgi:DNA polymerase I
VGGRLVSFQDPARCYTDARNYPIQAAAADLQLLAIQRIYAQLVERKLPAFLVNFVHDELVLEVREDLTDEVSSLLVEEVTGAFLELFEPYNPEPVAQELVEVGDGYNYAQAK